jgi:hypothetical protein
MSDCKICGDSLGMYDSPAKREGVCLEHYDQVCLCDYVSGGNVNQCQFCKNIVDPVGGGCPNE